MAVILAIIVFVGFACYLYGYNVGAKERTELHNWMDNPLNVAGTETGRFVAQPQISEPPDGIPRTTMFMEGERAYYAGLARIENPYKITTKDVYWQREHWYAGWDHAYRDELENIAVSARALGDNKPIDLTAHPIGTTIENKVVIQTNPEADNWLNTQLKYVKRDIVDKHL